MVTKSAKRITGFLGTSALTRPLFMLGAASALLGAGPAQALDANTLPQNPNVVGGKDSFHQSGNTLNVNQSTNRTVIDWRSFDIGSSAQVNFNQPGTSSIAVNRVNASANASQIEGGLHANGQVWILNPNGVFFGKTARVDAAGIVATTANIDANAFMAGSNKLQMTGADHGSVENQGKITVGANGLAAFVAPSVRNSGTINATVGRVALAAGTTYTLDLAGDHLVELGLGSVKAVVDSSGKIVNPGGTIALSAKAAGQVVNSVVNVSGVVTASSVTKSGGTITLGADNITTTSTAQLSADAGTNGNGGAITSVANVQGNYAGSFSAKGGSQSGNGGSVETSGKSVHVDDGIKVNTLASNGQTGNWTLDPDTATVTSGTGDNTTGGERTIGADTIVDNLSTTSFTLQADSSITVNSAIDASGQTTQTSALTLDAPTVDLNAPITLGAHETLTGTANIVNVGSGGLIQNGIDVSAVDATVNLGAATYALSSGVTIAKDGITLEGVSGTKITYGGSTSGNAVNISGDNVTVKGLEIDLNPTGSAQINGVNIAGTADHATATDLIIRGEVTGSYVDYAFGDPVSRGIAANNGATNVTISANNIQNIRTGILIDGRNTGSVTGNFIDNTKGALLIQYTDGSALTISGNSQGTAGNEWGEIWHLNQYWDGTTLHPNPYPGGAAPDTVQSGLLSAATANSGWTVMDLGYTSSNRTAVTVAASATNTHSNPADGNQGSYRSPLATIQAGVNAVVAGGTVNVLNGTYVASAANGYTNGYLGITKSLNLIGESEAGVIIDARNASTYGLRVTGPNSNVTLENFTLYGVTSSANRGGYGLKAEEVTGLTLKNITSEGAYKSEFDLNGVVGGTLDNLTANGYSVGTTTPTGGAGIQITDSQHISLTNSMTENNSWGGLSLQQSDTYGLPETDINVSDNNFTEATQIYAEDQSASLDFGTLNLAGYDYVVRAAGNPLDYQVFFEKTAADAIEYAAALDPSTAYIQGYVGNGTSGNNIFTVGTSAGGTALSINAAVNAAAAGATINVGDGTYSSTVTINKALTLAGAGMDETSLTGGIHILNSPAITGLTFTGFTVSGDGGSNTVVRQGNVTNFLMDHVRIDGGDVAGRFGFAGGNFSGDISITNSEFVNIRGWSAFDTSTSGNTHVLTSVVFSNNLLDNTVGHIAFRQSSPTADVTISDNIVRNVGDTTNLSSGIFKVFGAATVDFSGNDISGIGASPTKFSSGIADGAALIVNGVSTLNLTDNTFTDNQEAILVGDGNALPQTMTLTGNTFTNNAYDIQLAGGTGAGTLNFGAGNNFISGAQTQQHLLWGGTSDIDMTQVEFDGKLGSQMSNDELFATEDLITDGLDNAAYGFARLKTGNVYVTAASGSIQNALDVASSGDTVNVQAGTYGAFGKVSGDPSNVTIQTTEGAVIDGSVLPADKRIVELSGDGMTFSGFTINGTGAGVGISIDGQGVTVSGNTINNVGTGIQTHNTGNATITGNTITAAYGVSLQSIGNTVSGNTVTASTEGVGLLQSANTFSSNTFNIGAAGNALDYYGSATVTGLTASGNTVNIQGGGVQGAVDLAGTNGALNLAAGTYSLPSTLYINNKGLTLTGAGEGTTTIDGSGISNNFAMRVRADDVSLSGFTVSGPGGISVYSQSPTILHDASISHVTIDVGTAGYTGLTVAYTVGANVDHVTVDGTATGGAGSTGVQIIDASDVTLTNVKTFGNQAGLGIFEDDATGPQVNNINVDTTNSFLEDEPVFIVDTASANGPSLGSVNIQGFKYAVGNQADFGFGPGYLLNDQQTAIDDAAAMDASSSTVQGWTGTGVNNVFTVGFATDGTALSINTAANAATAGGAIDVNSGTYAEDVAIGKQLTFNFDGATVNSFTLASGAAGSVLNGDLTATGAIAFNGATSVTGDLKAASITATDAFALNGNAAASGAIALNGATTLAGNLTGGSIALGATTLTGNTSLDTSAANGAIKVASVNGATAGGQSLAIKAGTGSVSLGNAGATTRLGAVSDASKTTLTGSTYNANSFLFGGDVTLTSADTTLNTTQSAGAAGDITFQGDLFGTTDGSQSLTLIAGPGTGAASANGDILLQNAGTTAVNLNNLTVSGDDFTALTVDLAGNYNSLLTGNQVFAADTLNVKGNANSIVGGDASGHIVASGDVTIAAGGDVSGTISGENVNLTGDDVNSVVTANTAANIKGNTVEGSYTADTVTLIASNNVDAAVDATDFVLAANHGSVDGTWTTINTDGSNVVSVNGQTTVGMANVNPNQLVVEGFVLPAGTTIGANGQLILPEGTLLGLLSPGGGKPKMILVHTVHQLGELLASGYSVIVIDLSGHGKEKLVQLAAN